MDTPPPQSSAPSSASPSRSGLDHLLAKTPATLLQGYALYHLAPLLSSLPASDPRWNRVLGGFVIIVFPALASSALDAFRRSLDHAPKP